MTEPGLNAALRSYAKGIYPLEAGTELLISHRSWLERPDFRDRFIGFPVSITNGALLAEIDWEAVITALDTGCIPCSGGERRILQLSASLAGGFPVSLREAIPGLDDRNIKLVTTAILHAHGQRPEQRQPSSQG